MDKASGRTSMLPLFFWQHLHKSVGPRSVDLELLLMLHNPKQVSCRMVRKGSKRACHVVGGNGQRLIDERKTAQATRNGLCRIAILGGSEGEFSA